MMGITIVLAVPVTAAWHGANGPSTVLLGVLLLWAFAWFDLNLSIAQAGLQPARYGILMAVRSGLSLVLGYCLVVFLDLDGYGVVLALLASTLVGAILGWRFNWRGVRPVWDPASNRRFAAYGLPLTGTFALGYFLDSGDRFMIAAFLNEAAVGPYAAAYDLPRQTLGTLMMVVHLAAYPMAVRAYEAGGATSAIDKIRETSTLQFAISVPTLVGLVLVSKDLIGVLFGEAFVAPGIQVMPIAALGVFVGCLCPYLLDMAYQLSGRTKYLIVSPIVGTVLNVGLNWIWIPMFGIVGAAWATLVSSLAAVVVSAFVGRRFLAISVDMRALAVIGLSALLMAAAVMMLPEGDGISTLVPRVLVGVAVYVTAAMLLNVAGARTALMVWRQTRAGSAR
ncbi:MAG: polysaccharide biosynthesis C-terminal domain-containing protein [Burkholderiaceae bacterium]